ncbi:MAG: cytochrome c [Xanthobacteraceae bacterium]|uniref:c-type cytochrome n=1 Tax=Pseudolabrys sp. TaxID=1960880 RepID=UPI003D09DBB9
MLKGGTLIIALLWITAGADNASAQNGQALVKDYCSGCHAVGSTDKSPHPAAPPLRRIGDFYDLDEFASILESGRLIPTHPDMPTFRLDRARARAITNYLRSIRE